MGWLAGWAKRVKLTIDNGDITASLSDFPVLIHLSSSCGRNNDDVTFVFDELQLDANRLKIAVTTSDGVTECYVEVEKWDDANEKALLWVKAPTISDIADTDLYLYYDITHADNNARVGDPNSVPAENVWDGDFRQVIHMKDDPDTSHVRDSTTNDIDGTKQAANHPVVTTSGMINNAQDYKGSPDYITSPFAWNNEGTIEMWINHHSLPSGATGVQYYWRIYGAADDGMFLRISTWDSIPIEVELWYYDRVGVGWIECSHVVLDWNIDEPHYIVGTWSVADDELKLYIDGELVDTNSNFTITPNMGDTAHHIGSSQDGTYNLDAILDEFRFSYDNRNSAWVKATYESGRDHLLDFGSEEIKAIVGASSSIVPIMEGIGML